MGGRVLFVRMSHWFLNLLALDARESGKAVEQAEFHWLLDTLAAHHDGTRRLGRDDLRVYQRWLVKKIKANPYLYLAVDMGLGKTIAVLTALIDLEAEGEIEWPVLVVAPKLVATDTWPEEIEDWLHTQHLSYAVIVGTPRQRAEAARSGAKIHLVGYENFQWLRMMWMRKWPYRVMVCDEATRLKSGDKKTAPGKGFRSDGKTPRTGNRTSRFGSVARIRPLLDRVILMSGTPAPQGLIDLWGPMFILDHGKRLGKTMTAYKERWFHENRYNHSVKPHDHSFGEIMERVKDVMFALKSDDYITLPPLIPVMHEVTMPPALMERYKRFERELYDEVTDVEAVSAGVLVNKLLQFANGSLYVDDDTAEPVHELKMESLNSVVEEANGAPLLIAYEFRFDVARIMKRYPRFRMAGDRPNWKKDWDAGRIPGLVLHPASAGHGLNLQKGGHIGVFFGLSSSLEWYLQFIKRLYRSGQRSDHVLMHYILTRGTEDEAQMKRLTVKGVTQDAITDAVRVRREDIHAGG